MFHPAPFPGILFTGELWEFLRFTERHPGVISNILLFGLTSALGQVSARPSCCSLRCACLLSRETAKCVCKESAFEIRFFLALAQ